jgi:hypothetical protein
MCGRKSLELQQEPGHNETALALASILAGQPRLAQNARGLYRANRPCVRGRR